MNLNEFNKVNSLREKANGEKMSHEEYYTNIVNGIGLGNLINLIPATKEEIQKCIDNGDDALSGIPLTLWDNEASATKYYIGRIGVKSISLAQAVCTLKQAARMYAMEGK